MDEAWLTLRLEYYRKALQSALRLNLCNIPIYERKARVFDDEKFYQTKA